MDLNMCFVIQPFDDGKFDKRYRETFVPAIRNANLEPYRVDLDMVPKFQLTTLMTSSNKVL